MTITDIELQELADQKRRDAVALKEKLDKVDRLEMPDLAVVRINKICRTCGHKWHGNFFKSWLVKAKRQTHGEKQYVESYCDKCIEEWERNALRRQIETELQEVDVALRLGPTKSKKLRLMRSRATILGKLRDTHEPGGVKWAGITDRIRELNETIERLDK